MSLEDARVPRKPTTKTRKTKPADDTLAADLLIGGQAIADWLGVERHKVYHWLAKNQIPNQRIGDLYACSKSALRKHFGGK
jgi:phage antirepressor YoqD-like protein